LFFTILLAAPLSHPVASEARMVENSVHDTVPVFEGDVTRPYVVVGEIRDNLRKPFAFMASPTKEKIYAEIWERARKMGADAVINARFGETQRTMFDHGRTPISGTAIKYTDGAKAHD
jgi:uncharacterized protein YbjQ (UPF0145 family)